MSHPFNVESTSFDTWLNLTDQKLKILFWKLAQQNLSLISVGLMSSSFLQESVIIYSKEKYMLVQCAWVIYAMAFKK